MTRVERQDRWKMLSKALGHTSTLNWGRSFVSSLTRVSEETAPPAEPERAVLHAAQ
jgi:trehalose-6-phosphate synthase